MASSHRRPQPLAGEEGEVRSFRESGLGFNSALQLWLHLMHLKKNTIPGSIPDTKLESARVGLGIGVHLARGSSGVHGE